MILLSIIIPICNSEKTLEKCLDSIFLHRKFGDFEVIAINDGSTDLSQTILEEYSNKYSQLRIFYQNNKGVSEARNTGLKLSLGKYITFVDSDDFVEPGYVDEIKSITDSNIADLYLFNAYEENSNGKKIIHQWKKALLFTGSHLSSIEEMFLSAKLNAPWDKIFCSNIIKENELSFPKDIRLGEDILFELDYLHYINSVMLSPKILYNYSVGGYGLSMQKCGVDAIGYFHQIFLKYKYIYEYRESNELKYTAMKTQLQIIANYVGNLYSNKIGKNEIFNLISQYPWYSDTIKQKYKEPKNLIRKFVLKHKIYKIASMIFKK